MTPTMAGVAAVASAVSLALKYLFDWLTKRGRRGLEEKRDQRDVLWRHVSNLEGKVATLESRVETLQTALLQEKTESGALRLERDALRAERDALASRLSEAEAERDALIRARGRAWQIAEDE